MLKIGVIGTGNMGMNHIRNILELPYYYTLTGCYDNSPEQLSACKERFGITCFESAESLLEKTQAIVLAVPSSLHKEYGILAARYKQHTLMEKPIALSEEDGDFLCRAFETTGKIFMVGHIERYNPAVIEIKKILENEPVIIAIDVKRCSPFDKRISDTSVIYDLMIHDLDIVLNYLQKSPVTRINALSNTVKSNMGDYVCTLMQHESGAITTITASRVTESKIRTIEVHTENSFIQADLLNKTLQTTRKTGFHLNLGYSPMYKQENIIEKIMLPNIEPLKAELIEFAKSVNENRIPETDGASAVRALHWADKIHGLTG